MSITSAKSDKFNVPTVRAARALAHAVLTEHRAGNLNMAALLFDGLSARADQERGNETVRVVCAREVHRLSGLGIVGSVPMALSQARAIRLGSSVIRHKVGRAFSDVMAEDDVARLSARSVASVDVVSAAYAG